MRFTSFVNSFLKRKGLFVAISSFIEKIGGFCLVFIATRLIAKEDFGLIVYANTILVFLLPFLGFGIHQGLIRYGSITKSQSEKKQLFYYTLKKGIKYSAIFITVLVLLSPLLTSNLRAANLYLIILSFQLLSLFLFEMIRIYARLLNLNKLYSNITIIKTILIVILSLMLTFKFKSLGYTIAIAIAPLLVFLLYIRRLNITKTDKIELDKNNQKEIVIYGLNTSLGAVMSQLLYAVDILLIGNILINESAVAQYKVSNLIPFSFLILPLIFISTDFVLLANKSETDKNYIKKYYINYLKLFGVLSVLIFLFLYFFSSNLMSLFGGDYTDTTLFKIFSVGVVGALLFRIPLGNILSAIGLAKINTINSVIILVLNIVLGFIFISNYGVEAAALITVILMWLSGFLSLFFFLRFIKK